MKPEFIPASPALAHLIRYFVVLRSDETGITFRDKYVPDGYIGIVFLIRVKQLSVCVEEIKPMPTCFLVIPKIMPLFIEAKLPADSLIVICKAPVLSLVFNIRFNSHYPTPNIEIDLFNGFPLIEKFRNIDKTEDRIHFFEEYLLNNYPIANYKPDEIDLAYTTIIEKEGKVTVNEIIESLQVNYRTLRRNFHARVGISLKGMIRVVRVRYLLKLLMENNITDFQSITFMGNFYDQAHLINDFKKIVGESPKAFFSRNLENVKAISGFKS